MIITNKKSIRLLVTKSVYRKTSVQDQLHFHASEETSRSKCNSVNRHLKFTMSRNKPTVEDVSDFYGYNYKLC